MTLTGGPMGVSKDHRIRIISGHYGVGKSEFASNYALKLAAEGFKTVIVDLDIVNPYFTTRGISNQLAQAGIKVFGPSGGSTANDLPALPAEIHTIFGDDSIHAVIDLGGDRAGSKVLGRYRDFFERTGYDLFYCVNVNRPFSEDIDGVLSFYDDIENGTRLTINRLANTTHLLFETTPEEILKGETICTTLARMKNITYRYLVAAQWVLEGNPPFRTAAEEIFPISLTLRPDWLDYEKGFSIPSGPSGRKSPLSYTAVDGAFSKVEEKELDSGNVQ